MSIVNNHFKRLTFINNRHAAFYWSHLFCKSRKFFQRNIRHTMNSNQSCHNVIGIECTRQRSFYMDNTVFVCKRIMIFKTMNAERNSKTCRSNIACSKIRHVSRNKRQRLCFKFFTCLFASLAFCSKANYFLRSAGLKVSSSRIFQINNANRWYLNFFAINNFNMVVCIKCTEQICLIALILLVSSMKFKMFKRNIHKQSTVKQYISKSVQLSA